MPPVIPFKAGKHAGDDASSDFHSRTLVAQGPIEWFNSMTDGMLQVNDRRHASGQ